MPTIPVIDRYASAKRRLIDWDSPTSLRIKRRLYRGAVALYRQRRLPFPASIELETLNRCNGRCAFCPVHAGADPRPRAEMSWALMERIAGEIEARSWGGMLCLYSNNEPLLDPRLPDIVRLFAGQVPRATLLVTTNGSLLSFERWLALMEAGLSRLLINSYSDVLELTPSIAALRREIEGADHPRLASFTARTAIHLRRETELLSSRGGTAPNKPPDRYEHHRLFAHLGCHLPHLQLVVRPTGGVSQCCADALGQRSLGDASAQSLQEIWRGPAYRELRNTLAIEGRSAVPLCRDCDVSSVQLSLLRQALTRG
jgi:hypothetical protein